MKTSNPRGERFIADLISAMPDGRSELMLIARLNKWAGQTIYLPMQNMRERRIKAAANMLANGMAYDQISTAIADRFGVSSRTAQRDIENARKMSVNYVGDN